MFRNGLPRILAAGSKTSALIVIGLASFVSAGFAVPQSNLFSAQPAWNSASSSGVKLLQQGGRNELHISLNSDGFQPGEAQHAAGTFAIAIENSLHSGEYTIRLKAEDGTIVKEIQIQRGSTAFTVNLSAGQYTLTEPSNLQWVCRLTVQ